MGSFISTSMLKAWAFFLSIFYFLSGTSVMPPSTEDPIKPLDSYNIKLNVALWADPQISNYKLERQPYFEEACQDLDNAENKLDAVLVAGDVAENGLLCEYDMIAKHMPSDKVENYLMATGNHDIRIRAYKSTVKRFTEIANTLNGAVGSDIVMDKLNYKVTLNGYTFIILGSDKATFEEAWFSDEQFQWLDDSLEEAEKSGRPVFVVCHQSLKDSHGLPETWGSPFDFAGSVGKQSDRLFEIMNNYKRVVFITGHLHTGIGEYTYEKIGNIHSINLPSLTIDNENGTCNDNGIGFMMEAYKGKLVFRARNFAKGVYMPEYDFTLNF